jgi:hypothetical protein
VPTFRYYISVPFSSGKGDEVPVLDFLTVEAGTDWMSRNVGTNYHSERVIPQKMADHIYVVVEVLNHAGTGVFENSFPPYSV